MNKITSFLNNNSILFFSWACALFYFMIEYNFLEGFLVHI